jgi:hypothetical protein
MYQEASKVANQIDHPDFTDQILHLQVNIQYELEEMAHAKTLISQMP